MPGSTLSLESLSSPSPSPSPPPDRVAPKNSSHKSRSSNNTSHSTSVEKPASGATGLDSDSELSELTEEEQEAADKRAAADDEDTPGAHSARASATRRGGHQRSSSRRGGRRKRSSIVPAPMWGWVETKTASVVEEEEEEELVQPPRAMEEEEDEDEDDDEGDLNGDDTLRRPRPTLKNGHKAQPNGRHRSGHPSGSDLKDVVDHDMVEDVPTVVNGVDNGDEVDDGVSASGEDNSRPPSRVMAPTQIDRIRRSARTSLPKTGDEDQDMESASDEDVDEDDGPSIKLPHDNEAEDSLSDSEPDVVPPEPESENETEDEEDDLKHTFSTSQVVMPPNKAKPVSPTALVHAINATLPAPQDIVNITAAAAASSIMAGSQVLNVPSPASSASGSPGSSRSPSPAPSGKGSDAGDADDDLPSKTKLNKVPAFDKAQVDLVEDDDTTPTASSSHAKKVPPLLEIDVDMPDVDPENDPDRSVDDIEVDEPSPDDDLEVELESDLQPAHRAEALDVLATIELKFALLREKVYVEKMEGLAWEEELINQGNHPEMIHLHKELSKRRDKRLELASRKRSYEISNVAKRRRVDEDATWSWWKLARDDLQTDMIAETSRKRRRLERDRRAIERPQPIRRIPIPPVEAPPPPPSLRKIIKSAPFSNRHENKSHSAMKHYVYPELSTLSSADIASDLEFLYQNRRPPPYEAHRNPTSVNTQMGPPVPHPYDQYEGMVNSFAGGNRMQPPVQAYSHHAPPLQHMSSFPPYGPGPGPSSGRIHHPPSSHNHAHNHGQSQFPLDQEMGVIAGPGQQLMPHHPYFGAQANNGGNPFPGAHHANGRRSISPVNVIPNNAGKQNGSWMGMGMGMGNFIGGSQNGGEWMGDGRRNEMPMHEDDDRERALREREKREREQRDRESQEFDRERHYHMQQLAQQHRQQAPPLPHVHSGPAVPAHRHHHRPHHHHVVHHHHGPGPGHASSSLPPAGGLLHSPTYDNHTRPPPGSNHHQAEVLSHSSKPSTHWKDDQPQQHDYRHRRPSIGALDDRERPLSMPFVMSSTQPIASPNAHHLNGAGTAPGNMPWNVPEDPYRSGPANYLGAHEVPTRSPGHRYSNSGSGPPHLVGRVQQGGPGGNMGPGAMSPTRGRPARSPPPSGFRSPVRYGGVPPGPVPPLSSSLNGQSIAPLYPPSTAPTPTTRSPVMRPVSPLPKASSSMTSKASPPLQSRFSPSLPSRMSPPPQSRLSPPLSSKITSPVHSKVSSPVQSKHASPLASKVASPVTSKRASPVASKISSPLPAKLVVPTAPRLSGPGGVGGMLDMAKNSVGLGPERGGYTSPPLTDRERERHASSPRLGNGLLPLPSKMQMVDGH